MQLSDPGQPLARIPAHREEALLEDAAQVAGDPLLGWSLGDFELRDLGVYGYGALNAPDVRAALLALIDLLPLVTENARYILHEVDGEATFAQIISAGRFTDQVSLRALLCHMDELIGPDFEPLRAGLPEREAARLEKLRELAGLPITSAEVPINFVTFKASLLDRAVHGADHQLAQTLWRLWDEEKPRLQARTAALRRLQDAVVPLLPEGEPRLDRVALRLGISLRKLRLELDGLGLTISGLTDLVRADIVRGLLAEPGMTLSRAAHALGYADAAALEQAHRRWWGVAPVLGRLH
ncbi:MAG: AraC family transcriptional regulator ligand-binding domain-containing protein [Geminicoccaceae bacterium]